MDDRIGREVVQARLLAALFRQDLGGRLAVKGGMAMRTAYGSLRYTKDIDLACDPSLSVDGVERAVNAAFRTALGGGIITDAKLTPPSTAKRTETTLRWKLNGRIGGTAVHLTVEVSRRAALEPGDVKKIQYAAPDDYGMAPFVVDVVDMPLLATGKTDCLCNPHREEPRDVHDLAVLITLGVTPAPEMIARLGRDRIEKGLEMLWAKLDRLDWEAAVERLGPFLTPDVLAQLTPEVWDDMRLRVGTSVERWMRSALEDERSASDDDHERPAAEMTAR